MKKNILQSQQHCSCFAKEIYLCTFRSQDWSMRIYHWRQRLVFILLSWWIRTHPGVLYGCYVQDNIIYSSWFFKCNIILVHFHKIDVYYIVVILCSKIPDGKSLSALSRAFYNQRLMLRIRFLFAKSVCYFFFLT